MAMNWLATRGDNLITLVFISSCNDEFILISLSHKGDRIVFGGSHYFRLNNPKSIKALTTVTSSSGLKYFEFKGFFFFINKFKFSFIYLD